LQICSVCNVQVVDDLETCPNCYSNLAEYSTLTITLSQLKENPRVKSMRIAVSGDACPTCQQAQGIYSKDNVPDLPIEGCSHKNGCRCYYQPDLEEIYP